MARLTRRPPAGKPRKYAVDLVRRRADFSGCDEVGNVVVTDERGAEVLTVTFPKSAVERCG
jgi:hypothetical protein